jgi:arabinogalactan endo-1,4-beta-galactosidase
MILETGYCYAWPLAGTTFDYTSTYPYTEEGQRHFTADLVAKLNDHSSVKGLLWWWPEDNGNKNVTDSWWNAALYNHNTGQPYAAFYELKNFLDGSTGMKENLRESIADGSWYTLDGRRQSIRPAQKGVFIHNGRKITIQ